MNRRLCSLIVIEAIILSILYDRKINAAEQYRSKACRKRTIVRHDKDEGLVSEWRGIPICCKGWREFNETTCIKGTSSARHHPFRDIKIASAFLSKRTKRSYIPKLNEECSEELSCTYEEVKEHGFTLDQTCKFFKHWRCKEVQCRPGYHCDTWNDRECQNLNQYEVYCKACDAGKYGMSCRNVCSCPDEGFWKTECSRNNGTCYCQDGYTGINCDETCDNGTYGVGCKENCTCPANAICNHINGDCVRNSGLREETCSEGVGSSLVGSKSELYTESDTDNTWDITTQQIFQDQELQGSTSQRDKINIIIAAVTLGTLMVSIMIIITVVYKRKNGQQTMPSENVYAELNKMSQPLSQEYMYEDLRSRNSLENLLNH